MFASLHYLLHLGMDPLEKALMSVGLGVPELITILFVVGVIIAIPWVNIFLKAGYSPLRGYLMFVPILNIFVFFSFAFGEWPIERECRSLSSPSRRMQDVA
jgi:hypothetical protein